jgi:hypothetical protein
MLQCMSPPMAQSGHAYRTAECPLLGGKADIDVNDSYFRFSSKADKGQFWPGIVTVASARKLPAQIQISDAGLFLHFLNGNALAANHVVAFLGRFAGDFFCGVSRNDVAHCEGGKRQRYDDLFHGDLPLGYTWGLQGCPHN